MMSTFCGTIELSEGNALVCLTDLPRLTREANN